MPCSTSKSTCPRPALMLRRSVAATRPRPFVNEVESFNSRSTLDSSIGQMKLPTATHRARGKSTGSGASRNERPNSSVTPQARFSFEETGRDLLAARSFSGSRLRWWPFLHRGAGHVRGSPSDRLGCTEPLPNRAFMLPTCIMSVKTAKAFRAISNRRQRP